MTTMPARESGKGLSRDVYADAALDFIDAHGVEPLSLRALGSQLGVHATAVYRHFGSKNEVLEAALQRMLERENIQIPETGTPREQILALLRGLRDAFQAHPHMAVPNLTLQDEQATVEFVRYALSLLEQMGLQGDDLVVAYQMLETFSVGTNAYDWGEYPEALEGRRRGRRLVGHPAMDTASRSIETMTEINDRAFELAAEALLDAVERLGGVDRSAVGVTGSRDRG